jgi:hypothetical protein
MLAGPLGDVFTFGAQSTRCLFDDAQQVIEDETGFEVTKRMRIAHIRTGSLTGLSEEAAVTVAGVAYVVRKILPTEDGQMTRVILARVDR